MGLRTTVGHLGYRMYLVYRDYKHPVMCRAVLDSEELSASEWQWHPLWEIGTFSHCFRFFFSILYSLVPVPKLKTAFKNNSFKSGVSKCTTLFYRNNHYFLPHIHVFGLTWFYISKLIHNNNKLSGVKYQQVKWNI